MNCKICGAQLVGNETVCPVCGAPIENNIQNTTPAVPIPEAPVVPVEPVVDVAPVAPVEPVVEQPVAPAAPIPEAPVVPVEPVAESVPAAPIPETPVVPVEPVVEPVPAAPIPETPVVPVAPVVDTTPAPASPAVEPYQATQTVMPEAVTQVAPAQQAQPVKQKRPVNVKFVVFMIVGVLLIGFLLFWTYVIQADPQTPATPATPEVPEVVEETFTFGGQEFTMVEGYEYTTNDNYGAVISNGTNTYTFEIDYTNNLDAYKTKLTEVYPDKVSAMTKTIGSREYYVIEVKDSSENVANLYVTKTSDDYVVTGFVMNSENAQITDDDFTGLNSVLDGITTTADYDKALTTFGNDGVKLLTFDKTKLS